MRLIYTFNLYYIFRYNIYVYIYRIKYIQRVLYIYFYHYSQKHHTLVLTTVTKLKTKFSPLFVTSKREWGDRV